MLSAILVLFAVLSIVYNVATPLFEGPDEAAHFLYIDYLATGKGLPALDDAPREVLWEGLQQPPLYYALGALLTGWVERSDLRELLWHNPHRGGETGGINLYYHSTPEAFPYRGTTLAVHLARLLNTLCGVVTVLATFLAALDDPSVGAAIAIAIALHNIPEGISVSVPIFYATGKRRQAFMYSLLSGMAEPVGAIVAYLALRFFLPGSSGVIPGQVMGVLFGFVAGIMVYISLDELLPTSRAYGKGHDSLLGLVGGMAVMAFSLLLMKG